MKINSTFHVLILFIVVLMFNMPFVALAQQSAVETDAIACC